MTDRLHLPQRYRRILEGLLREHVPEAEVWAYGSRVTGESHEESDLDLVVRGPELKPLDDGFFKLQEAIEQVNIPILVQVHDWARLPESFQQDIERDYVVLQHFARSEAGGLLSAWQWVQFGDCADLIRDSVSPTEMGESLYIGLEHIGEGTLSFTGHGTARDVTSTKLRFQRGDILFGKLRPYFRKVVRAPDRGVCSTDVWVIRGINGVNQDFLYYCMASQEFVDFATAGSEGTRMPRAIWEHVSKYNIALPPLPEQRAIAHILGTLDDKIELNRRMNETLEEMARALFKSWFVDFDPVRAKAALASHRPDHSDWTVERAKAYLARMDKNVVELFPDRLTDSELGEIPEGWEVGKFGDIVSRVRKNENPASSPGTVFSHFSLPAFDEGQNPKRELGERIKSTKSQVVQGNVLLSKLNPEIERVWLVDVAPDEKAVCSTEFLVLEAKPPFQSSYLYCLSLSPGFRQQLESIVTGTSKSHQRAPADAILTLETVIPHPRTSEAFETSASELLQRRMNLHIESRSLAEQRDALLPQLVSGETAVASD